MTVDQNRLLWGNDYSWPQDGGEWSEWWGTPRSQWFGCLLPRIFPFLGGSTLEIATGRGRWTQFLLASSTSLIGIDIVSSCVEFCKQRFKDLPHVTFCLNDGRTLPGVANASIDFVFSFDSLVHSDADTMESYTRELQRVLKPNTGVAFIHHSNLAGATRSIYKKVRDRLSDNRFDTRKRSPSMSAKIMRGLAGNCGMSCVHQELVPWGCESALLLDCMSTIVNRPNAAGQITINRRFMNEAASIKLISSMGTTMEPPSFQ